MLSMCCSSSALRIIMRSVPVPGNEIMHTCDEVWICQPKLMLSEVEVEVISGKHAMMSFNPKQELMIAIIRNCQIRSDA